MAESRLADMSSLRADASPDHPSDSQGGELVIRSGGKTWRVPWPDPPRKVDPPRTFDRPSETAAHSLRLHSGLEEPTRPPVVQPDEGPRVTAADAASVSEEEMRGPTSRTGSAGRARRGVGRDAFRNGCAAGLALGCLAMVMFHQLEPSGPATAVELGANRAAANGAIAALASTDTGSAVEIPGTAVDVLVSGPYPSKQAAYRVSRLIQPPGVVVGTGPYRVWWDATLTQDAAASQQQQLKKKGVAASIQKVSWTTASVTLPVATTSDEQKQLENWVAAEVSALRAITGAVLGQAPSADAIQAGANAEHWRPSSDVSGALPPYWQSGVTDVGQALAQLRAGNNTQAMRFTVRAWYEISQLTDNRTP
ncbi:MAG: hypothetical protein K6T78_05935 [Alicyclobacillus sp.]|nr:hypothetical protein [Alicyclobacillus sp.]